MFAVPIEQIASQNEAVDSLADDADYFDVACLNCNPKLFGLIAPSDRDFYCFVSPQSNVLLFEDPRTLSEVRMHFVNQSIPNSNPVFLGDESHRDDRSGELVQPTPVATYADPHGSERFAARRRLETVEAAP